MRTVLAMLLLVGAATAQEAARPEGLLKKGHRVAVVGDSITEQKLYSRYLEVYLLASLSHLDLKVIQLGWSGEVAPGFVNRMNNDLLPWRPDVVTTCYGMNDGGYKAWAEDTGKRYRAAMAEIVKRLKNAGAVVVVGSPGAVDSKYFKGGGEPARVYNDTLAHLRDVARQLADETGMRFANVHDAMNGAQQKAKAVLGEGYEVCGRDGFHPGPNGQLAMAYAFLRGLGVDGAIGTITLDAASGKAEATEGHAVLKSDKATVEIESSRWPFCFQGDEKSPGATRSIVPFLPFNADLNRLTLVVKGLGSEKAKVTWGSASKSFTKADLEKGVNLAAEFPDNPFQEPFRKLETRVAAKQAFETSLIKGIITSFPNLTRTMGPEMEASLEALRRQALETHDSLHKAARAAVVPVRHAVSVTPE